MHLPVGPIPRHPDIVGPSTEISDIRAVALALRFNVELGGATESLL